MKKSMIKGMALLAMGFAFVACSHDTNMYDENFANKEREAEYQQAFEKAFGKIAVGNDWGFGAAAVTRASATTGFEDYIITGLHKPINGVPKEKEFIDKFNKADAVTDINYSDYFLQHVIKQTKKGKVGWGTKDQHHQMAQLQAYNYRTGEWEDVANFEKGKSEKQLINGNNETHGTTLMVNMGTPNDHPQFRWIATKNAEVGEGYECENYVIKKVEGQYYLGMSYANKPSESANAPAVTRAPGGPGGPAGPAAEEAYNMYDAWIIRLVKAELKPNKDYYQAYGRVMCEDLGSTAVSDLDFNDVVFDAYILNDGSINITVLAAGGMLRPVTVGEVEVSLPQMCNTDYNDIVADPQEFTIPASVAKAKGWTSIDKIPVTVRLENGEVITLEAKSDGTAPAKVCTYVGVPWAKEKIKLDEAYKDWTEYVTTKLPKVWYGHMVRANICPLFFDETEIETE